MMIYLFDAELRVFDMRINWKQLANSTGYKSLKADYIHDVQKAEAYRIKFNRNPMREKAKLYSQFQWVINRAKHYAAHTGKSIEGILNEWEEGRRGWWYGYYQDAQQPKYNTNARKPMGIKGRLKQEKKWRVGRCCNKNDFAQWRARKEQLLSQTSKKQKPRWSMQRKKRGY